MKSVGSRAEVWHGTAKKTSGGLLKKDLKMNKRGRIVSKKMSNRAKKDKRLEKAGYKTKKGKFTLFKSKKKRGGSMVYVAIKQSDNSFKIFPARRHQSVAYDMLMNSTDDELDLRDSNPRAYNMLLKKIEGTIVELETYSYQNVSQPNTPRYIVNMNHVLTGSHFLSSDKNELENYLISIGEIISP